MAQQSRIVFYTADCSPFCERTQMALTEAKADYTPFIIDVHDKPTWFVEKVNPIGRIPAMTYGGASASPEDPSPDSVKLAESLVITTFIGDIFPESKVVPADPAQRALAMLFATTFETSVIDAWRNFFFEGAPSANLLKALEAVQARLPGEGKGSFAIGEWSFADIAAAPVLVRIVLMLENGYGPAAERETVLETLKGPKFARLLRYIEDIRARPSFQKAFDVEKNLAYWKRNSSYFAQ